MIPDLNLYFQGSGSLWSSPTNNYSLEEGEEGRHLQFITGVIDRNKVAIFERGLSCNDIIFQIAEMFIIFSS